MRAHATLSVHKSYQSHLSAGHRWPDAHQRCAIMHVRVLCSVHDCRDLLARSDIALPKFCDFTTTQSNGCTKIKRGKILRGKRSLMNPHFCSHDSSYICMGQLERARDCPTVNPHPRKALVNTGDLHSLHSLEDLSRQQQRSCQLAWVDKSSQWKRGVGKRELE